MDARSVAQRYETKLSNLMTLRVTRQGQTFRIGKDQQHVDLKLIQASVELVGEPGTEAQGGVGCGLGFVWDGAQVLTAAATSMTTLNQYEPNWTQTINPLYQYSLYGDVLPNHVQTNSYLDHGWASVEIEGLTTNVMFQQDKLKTDNNIHLPLPTDLGLVQNRCALQSGYRPMMLNNTTISNEIRVNTKFMGTAPDRKRIARFVQDWADVDPSTRYLASGEVDYYAGGSLCVVPANMISQMLLVFEVTPRSTI